MVAVNCTYTYIVLINIWYVIVFVCNCFKNLLWKLIIFELFYFTEENMEVDDEPMKTHQTLEFFEMCADLITTLAR